MSNRYKPRPVIRHHVTLAEARPAGFAKAVRGVVKDGVFYPRDPSAIGRPEAFPLDDLPTPPVEINARTGQARKPAETPTLEGGRP